MKEIIYEMWEQASKDWQRPILGNSIVVLSVVIAVLASEVLFDAILGASDTIRLAASVIIAMSTVVLVHYVLKKRGW